MSLLIRPFRGINPLFAGRRVLQQSISKTGYTQLQFNRFLSDSKSDLGKAPVTSNPPAQSTDEPSSASAPAETNPIASPPKKPEPQESLDEILEQQPDLGEKSDAKNTGVIKTEKRLESLFYFHHMIPYLSSKYDYTHQIFKFFYDTSDKAMKEKILKITSSEENPVEILIDEIISVPRDGGCFVKFDVPKGMEVNAFNKKIIDSVQENATSTFLYKYVIRPNCFPVKGTPWIEDLGRYPSSRIKVGFGGPDLTQESLYMLFRRYGKISDIILPEPDAKAPRSARVQFRQLGSGICARHCITGLHFEETILHIQYEPIVKKNAILEFINSHQRISIPIILALLAGVAVIIFDPIRHFFVTEKIASKYDITKNILYQEVSKIFNSTVKGFNKVFHRRDKGQFNGGEGLWNNRMKNEEELKLWLQENVNTFIVVQGPSGSGKRDLVEQYVLRDRKNVLYVDCENLTNARKDNEFIKNFAKEFGYSPIFAWLSTAGSFIDLLSVGLTGQKSGLTESKESQVKNVLAMAATAIRDLSLSNYENLVSEAEGKGVVPMKEADYLQQNPEQKPVIVIDRFQASKKGHSSNAFVYKELADWAANLIALNVAHVIFITDDIGSLQVLRGSLPSHLLKRTILSDAAPFVCENYVWEAIKDNQISKFYVNDEKRKQSLFDSVDQLGGRLFDIQMFIRRLKSGDSPDEALNGLIFQTIEELSQVFTSKDYNFTSSEAWGLMKLLAEFDEVQYSDVYALPLYKTKTLEILVAMENAELISVVRDRGLITAVKAGSPLYKLAFKQVVSDPVLSQSLETTYLNHLIGMETAKIASIEEELTKYRGVGDSGMFKPRLKYLAGKVDLSTQNIIKYDAQIAVLANTKHK